MFNKINDALTRSYFYIVYSIDVDIRQQECDLLKYVFVSFFRLLDELNISSKTGMLCFAVLTQYSYHCIALLHSYVFCLWLRCQYLPNDWLEPLV